NTLQCRIDHVFYFSKQTDTKSLCPASGRPSLERGNRKGSSVDKKQQAKDFIASRGGAVRAIVLRDAGIHSEILRRMVAEGTLFVPMRGVYALRDLEFAQESSLAFVAARNPDLVLCLKSAAILHGLT